MDTILYTISGIVILWSLWGFVASNVEQAEYTTVDKKHGYEIRLYPEHIVAETVVSGEYGQALSTGFSRIAGFIFGGNTKNASISMTAPVQSIEQTNEKIAMTAPVLTQQADTQRVIQFVMPKKYTLETLPLPNDSSVTLKKIPEKTYAAIRFFGYRNEAASQKMEARLREKMAADGYQSTSAAIYAAYNGPGTPPWMMRNEILIEIQK
jgi:hypothetical protein